MLKFLGKDKEIKEIKQTINIINQHNSVISQNNNADFEMIKSSINILRSNIELLKSDKLDELKLFDDVVNDMGKIDKDLQNVKKVFLNYNTKLRKYVEFNIKEKNILKNEINNLRTNNKILNEKFDILFEMIKNNQNHKIDIPEIKINTKEIPDIEEEIPKEIKKPKYNLKKSSVLAHPGRQRDNIRKPFVC